MKKVKEIFRELNGEEICEAISLIKNSIKTEKLQIEGILKKICKKLKEECPDECPPKESDFLQMVLELFLIEGSTRFVESYKPSIKYSNNIENRLSRI